MNISQSLLENGLDSITHAFEHYCAIEETTARRYKYSILHLSQGILLLLKERIFREHPALLRQDLRVSSEKTLDTQGLFDALQTTAGISISKSDVNIIAQLIKDRNQIEHNAFALEKENLDQHIAETVMLLLTLCKDLLKIDLSEEIPNWIDLASNRDFQIRAAKIAQDKINKLSLTPHKCDFCSANTAIEENSNTHTIAHPRKIWVQGKMVRCLVCRKFTAFVTFCPKCQTEQIMASNKPCVAYCSKCHDELRKEHSGLSNPILAEEVGRFFKDFPKMYLSHFRKIQDYLFTPTSLTDLLELIDQGVVKFTQKKYLQSLKSAVRSNKPIPPAMRLKACLVLPKAI